MGTELLVDNKIENGQSLLSELAVAGFDVSVAFWVKTADEGLWYFYIASAAAEPSKVGDAYRTLYACLSKIHSSVGTSQVMLVPPSNPIAQDAMAIRDRQSNRRPVRIQDKRLGNLSVEEGYVYARSAAK